MEFLERFKNITSRQIILLMVLFALTLPFLILPSGRYGTEGVQFRGYTFLAMIWEVGLYSDGPFYVLDPLSFILGSPLLLFAYYVQRYCSGSSSWKATVLIGLLLTTIHAVLISPRMLGWFEYDTMVYAGPLPITLILGLLLMKIVGAPELDRPFDEQVGSSSWWKRGEQV